MRDEYMNIDIVPIYNFSMLESGAT